jgi:hypothetical protein
VPPRQRKPIATAPYRKKLIDDEHPEHPDMLKKSNKSVQVFAGIKVY